MIASPSSTKQRCLVDPERLARRTVPSERRAPKHSSHRPQQSRRPVLADALLTPQQRLQSKYDYVLVGPQLERGQRLFYMENWDLGGLSWFNVTLLE